MQKYFLKNLFLLSCFHFFHQTPGILYIVLKNHQICRKNTESVMSSSPQNWRQTSVPLSHHVVPLLFCCKLGAPQAKPLTNSLPVLQPRFALLHVSRGMSHKLTAHTNSFLYICIHKVTSTFLSSVFTLRLAYQTDMMPSSLFLLLLSVVFVSGSVEEDSQGFDA